MTHDWKEAAEKWLRDNNWDYKKYGDRRGDRSAYDTLMNYEITEYLGDAFQAGAERGYSLGRAEVFALAEPRIEQLKQQLAERDAEKIIDADNLALKEVEEKVEEKAAEIMKLESECDQLRARIEDAEKALKFYAKGNGGRACADDYFAKHAGEGKKS